MIPYNQPQEEVDNTIPFDAGTAGVEYVDPTIASVRANRAAVALQGKRNYEDLYTSIVEGREEQIRQEIASDFDMEKEIFKQEALKNVLSRSGPLQPQDIDFILNAAEQSSATDPKDVFEVAYAKEFMSYLDKAWPEEVTFWEEFKEEDAGTLNIMNVAGSQAVAKQGVALKEYQDAAEAVSKQSWLGYGVDFLKNISQIYTEIKLRGQVEGTSFWNGFLGASLADQARTLLRKPYEEYKAEFAEIMDGLKRDNPQLAVKFAAAVAGMSTEDEVIDNALTVAMGIGLGSLAGKAGQLATQGAKALSTKQQVAAAVKQLVKSSNTAENINTPAVALEAAGDLGQAATAKVKDNVAQQLIGKGTPQKELVESLQSGLRADMDALASNTGSLSKELVNRIVEQYNKFGSDFINTVSNVARVSRVPVVEASAKAIDDIRKAIKDDNLYPGLDNTILDVGDVYHEPLSNTYHVNIKLGINGAELFRSPSVAKNFAKSINLAEGTYKIVPQGKGFYINVTKPLDETSDIIRDSLLTLKTAKDPDSWFTSWSGWLRTPDETLSYEQRMNRKIATYAPAALMEIARETAKDLKALSRGKTKIDPITGKAYDAIYKGRAARMEEFNRILKLSQKMPDPKTGEPGYFFQSPGELEQAYLTHLKRMPDDVEVASYFSFKRLIEMDRMVREISMFRNMSRLGFEQQAFHVLDETGNRLLSPKFAGKVVKGLPGSEATILIVGKSLGMEDVKDSKHIPAKKYKKLREDIENGKLKVIQIWDPDADVLSGFFKSGLIDNKRIQYIVTDNVTSTPLQMNQIPRRGGGHWEYDYEYYIKQAKIRPERIGNTFRHWYVGDTTIMPMQVGKMGRDFANKLDHVRVLLKVKKNKEARAYAEQNLPIDWKEVSAWFRPHKVNGTMVPARLSLDEPIRLVPKNTNVIDLDGDLPNRYLKTFKDGTRQGSPARQNAIDFVAPRDSYEMFTINDVGTKHKPLYAWEEARLVDPMTTMNRSLSRIANSLFMDDYKYFSIEHWLRQASPYINAHPDEIKQAPFYFFAKGPELFKDVDPTIANRLKVSHWQIRQFMGVRDPVSGFLDSAAQKLADTVYERFGPKGLQITPIHLIPKVNDVTQVLRSFAFNMKLGLFAIPQIMVQSQTYGTIYGIAGHKMATAGTAAALMHQIGRLNKDILNGLDEKLSQLNVPGTERWKLGEFKEAYEGLQNSGFGSVAGEFAMIDDVFSPKLFRTGTGDFLHAGQFFFREAERNVRFGAWYTAYKEFRSVNPTGAVSPRDWRKIQERADLLSVNMSRASNSALHQGIFSIPAQFLTYQLRLGELMLGKRLTTQERMRLLAVNAALYGVPTSLGVTGFPIGDSLRQGALENGYTVGDNFIETTMMEGLPALIMGLATGNWYNVGDRYGAQGFEFLRELMYSDKSWWSIVGGASFSTLAGTFELGDGFMRAMLSGIRDDGESFPLTANDIADVFKEVSSFNNAWRTVAAVNTGRWMSKKEFYLDAVSPLSAIFMGLTGLQPTNVSDLFLQSQSLKSQAELEKWAADKFVQEMRRSFPIQNDDPDQAHKHRIRAFAYLKVGGVREDRIPALIAKSAENYESMIRQMDWNFYIRKPKIGREEQMLKTFQKKRQIEGNRN